MTPSSLCAPPVHRGRGRGGHESEHHLPVADASAVWRCMMHRLPSQSGQEQCPDILWHLQRLTRSFIYEGQRTSYIHVYARPVGPGPEPPLEYITAQDSGFEGIACVDDAARAAILALRVHEDTGSAVALRLALD